MIGDSTGVTSDH